MYTTDLHVSTCYAITCRNIIIKLYTQKIVNIRLKSLFIEIYKLR